MYYMLYPISLVAYYEIIVYQKSLMFPCGDREQEQYQRNQCMS
jgi:hypothetical protein